VLESEVFWNRSVVLFARAGNFNAAGEIEQVFIEKDWDMSGESLLELARALVKNGKREEAGVVVGLIKERQSEFSEEVIAGIEKLSL
jgi:hypothetical protein